MGYQNGGWLLSAHEILWLISAGGKVLLVCCGFYHSICEALFVPFQLTAPLYSVAMVLWISVIILISFDSL
jgi:hypothetical protein